MADWFTYTILTAVLILFELLYFKIADHFNIIDAPNHRSSHSEITIRGGGVIFPIAAIFGAIIGDVNYVWFLTGLSLVSVISFWDDVINLNYIFRSVVQLIAVSLLLYQLKLHIPPYLYLLIIILIVGTINAYNFMDGINGIAGAYSLVTLGALFYINRFHYAFTSETLLVSLLIGTMVFNFFNFRNKAKCFAGDVGSVSMAFILSFLIIRLIADTENYLFVGLMLLYGLDTVTTILFRLVRKENIFDAHRSHFYQYLVNEHKWKHISVALLYCVVQLLINISIIFLADNWSGNSLTALAILIVIGGLVYLMVRFAVEGSKYLLAPNHGRVD